LFLNIVPVHDLRAQKLQDKENPSSEMVYRWDKHVVIYGEEKLKRDHPAATFLAKDNHAKSVNVFADG